MSEENKAIYRRFLEETIINKNPDAADQYVASDFVDHGAPPGTPPGLQGFKQMMGESGKAFPDSQYTSHDLIADGDKVVSRGTFSGTHRGDFMGIPATGKRVEISEIHIARMSGGKIVEHWQAGDQLGMMQQLGVIPTPE